MAVRDVVVVGGSVCNVCGKQDNTITTVGKVELCQVPKGPEQALYNQTWPTSLLVLPPLAASRTR